MPTHSTDVLEKLLLVTYVLDLPAEFKQVTKALIKHSTSAYDISDPIYGLEAVQNKILCKDYSATINLQHSLTAIVVDIHKIRNDTRDALLTTLQPHILAELLQEHNCDK